MAELTFKSPGVSTREIDLSGPRRVGPTGVPAGVIGTAQKGRAFIPLVFADFSDFVAEFGSASADKFGPLALREWFLNARAGLYLKVLGVGDGKARLSSGITDLRGNQISAGSVTNAGFVVGSQMVNPNTGTVSHTVLAGDNQAEVVAQGSITVGAGADKANMDNDEFVLTDSLGTSVTFIFDKDSDVADGSADGSGRVIIGVQTPNQNESALATRIITVINTQDGGGTRADLKITASEPDPNPGDAETHVITLKQDVPGASGNTVISATQTGQTTVSFTSFSGGKNYNGYPGRTHFLGCLMKETAPSAATAEFTFADGVVTVDRKIKIISTDGTAIEYISKAGQVLGSNHFDGSGNAGAKATSLAACINDAAGHAGKITAVVDGGKITLTQKELGREGNQLITSDLDIKIISPSNK